MGCVNPRKEDVMDNEQVVNTPEESTAQATETPEVNAETTSTQQTQTPETTDTGSSEAQEVKESAVGDDRPIQNVAWEAKRKADELYSTVTPLVQEIRELKERLSQPQQPQQPKYGKAELQAFLSRDGLEEGHRIWALEEIDKIDKEDRRKEMQDIFTGYQRKTVEETKRRQAFNDTASMFPQMFIKDAAGNVLGFNTSDPLYMKVDSYLRSDPVLSSHPESVLAATKMAAFDLGLKPQNTMMNKLQQTQAQLRREQKKTLVSSGGSVAPTKKQENTRAKLIEEYRSTGSKEVFRELLRTSGVLPKE